jgi:hypothetical protein
MLPRFTYRHVHDQTNVAVTTTVLLAEFGLVQLDTSKPRQELTLHGLLQRGLYREERGLLLRNALRHLSVAGLKYSVLHDAARTAAIENRIRRETPEFEFQFFRDLATQGETGLHLDSVFSDDARLLIVDVRHSTRGMPIHVLLARREGPTCYVMNSHTGQDHAYQPVHLAAHLASPVGAGAVSFAGLQYLYTGIAVRVWQRV